MERKELKLIITVEQGLMPYEIVIPWEELLQEGFYNGHDSQGWHFKASIEEMRLKDYKIGDRIHFNSYEGIKQHGNGIIVDLWESDNHWYATVQCTFKTVCIMDSDI